MFWFILLIGSLFAGFLIAMLLRLSHLSRLRKRAPRNPTVGSPASFSNQRYGKRKKNRSEQ